MPNHQRDPHERPQARHGRPETHHSSPQARHARPHASHGNPDLRNVRTETQPTLPARQSEAPRYSQQNSASQAQWNQSKSWQTGQRSQAPRHVPVMSPSQAATRPATSQVSGPESYSRSQYSKSSHKKNGPWRVVFWVSLIIFVCALIALGVIGFSYWQGQKLNDEVAEVAFVEPADIEGVALSDLTVDWDALLAINPDTVAWLYIPGTEINYPVVQGEDNDWYLTHDFKGSEGLIATFGSVFLDYRNSEFFSDANNFMYGHNLNDGSMFADIADWIKTDGFNENRTVYVLTPQGNFKLNTFALIHCAADDPLVQTSFNTEEERVAYIQDKIDRSLYSVTDIPAPADMGKLFTFSTCDNLPSDGRIVLFSYVQDSTTSNGGVSASEGTTVDPGAVDATSNAAEEMAAEQ